MEPTPKPVGIEKMDTKHIIEKLHNLGVKNVVCAPGGRCKPLLEAFASDKRFKLTTVYDERTAGFYALGLSFEAPTVVLTTSGSAVTELHSAVVEAFYQKGSQLIMLTADRPLELRHTGAPQTIDQSNIFKNHCREFFDLTESENQLDLKKVNYPLHINVCLSDPNPSDSKKRNPDWGPLVIVSELNKEEKESVKHSLKDYRGCVILEPLSNLSESDLPQALTLKYSESFIKKLGLNAFTKVIRMGGVPVSRVWRDTDSHSSLNTYYVTDFSDFKGGLRPKPLRLNELNQKLGPFKHTLEMECKVLNYAESVQELMGEYLNSEVSVLNRCAHIINEEDLVFLGNSLPVREWDFVSKKNLNTLGQRGVNGIDGSLAMALGRASNSEKKLWVILGDLTTLYNFNDLQLLKNCNPKNIKIVVINNSGGQIFSRVFKNHKNLDLFLNTHDHSFEKIAEFWKLKYTKNIDEFEDSQLIELTPDNIESEKFWSDLHEIEV